MMFVYVALLMLIATSVIGWLFEILASAMDQRRMPGKIVEAGGQKLHVVLKGVRSDGDPAIILDGGLSANSLAWPLVEAELSNRYQTVSFDRAGHLWSPVGKQPRDAERNNAELLAVLRALDVKPPYIYVAHSYSGFLARIFTAKHPELIAGLVLPETTTAEIADILTPSPAEFKAMRRSAFVARFGVSRIAQLFAKAHDMPPGPLKDIVATWSKMTAAAKAEAAIHDELATFKANGALADETKSFGDLPMIVIASDRAFSEFPVPEDMTREEADTLNVESQKSLIDLSACSEFWMADQSGHEIPWDQPEIIVRAVDWTVAQWRLQNNGASRNE
ncbi:MAG: alpha/beta hydrolase [Pseudomonadota bacterium]